MRCRSWSGPKAFRVCALAGILVSVLAVLANAQARGTVTTRSPHGDLNVACQNCHTVLGWKPIRAVPEFDHRKTSFPLLGMHQNVSCTQCHTKPIFSNTGTRCGDCHADIHHRQMGTNCERCHNVKGWQVTVQSVGNHENRFPLVGGHASLPCDNCHKGAAVGQFQGLSFQCYSCHSTTYQQTTAPSHATAGFPTSCEQCHAITTWLGATFDHLKVTGFALSGAHASLDCTACHVNGKYKGTPANCVGCHMPDFRKASNPNHVGLGFPQTCQDCHNTAAWQPANFNHSAVGFPLTGAHAKLQCADCHANGNFNLTSAACSSCHMKDYTATTNPNHPAAGFPTDCSVCHSTSAWQPAAFDHSKSGFPLTGWHLKLQCADCHKNGNYNLTTATCVSCHLNDYKGTTNPNHVTGGFPQQCDVCHSTSAWQPASFNHNNTTFPLVGAHTSVPCASCHVNNNYTSIPSDCYSCHKTEYQTTNNPNHVAAGFPTTCQTCHQVVAGWAGATFNHTWFSTNHGGANGVCATCHTNPSNYAVFQCTNCHAKASTDQNHQGVSGYVYNSINCYQCHKGGGGGG